MAYSVPVGLSNKHLHLTEEDYKVLFGDEELVADKWLKQPAQFGALQKVEVVGPKGSLKNVRILGPFRSQSQVEISATDARTIGVKAPIRQSGDHAGTPGVKLVGPKGELELKSGVLVAARHVHLSTEQAAEAGLKDKAVVRVWVGGERGVMFENVLVRVSDSFTAEMHVDTDEGNAASLENGQMVDLIY